jgi:hypothetical protein
MKLTKNELRLLIRETLERISVDYGSKDIPLSLSFNVVAGGLMHGRPSVVQVLFVPTQGKINNRLTGESCIVNYKALNSGPGSKGTEEVFKKNGRQFIPGETNLYITDDGSVIDYRCELMGYVEKKNMNEGLFSGRFDSGDATDLQIADEIMLKCSRYISDKDYESINNLKNSKIKEIENLEFKKNLDLLLDVVLQLVLNGEEKTTENSGTSELNTLEYIFERCSKGISRMSERDIEKCVDSAYLLKDTTSAPLMKVLYNIFSLMSDSYED